MQQHCTARSDRGDAPPMELPAAHRPLYDALPASDRALVTSAALARWAPGLDDEEYTPADIARLERGRRQALATIRDAVELTDLEFRFVRLLQRHEGRTVRFDEIVRHLWPAEARLASAADLWDRHGPFARHVRHVHVLSCTVRRKLEVDHLRPQHIVSMRSVGYRWYSRPPARDDGEEYTARADEARRARYEIRGHRGELPPPRASSGRFGPGPEHPDYQAVDATVTERTSRRPSARE